MIALEPTDLLEGSLSVPTFIPFSSRQNSTITVYIFHNLEENQKQKFFKNVYYTVEGEKSNSLRHKVTRCCTLYVQLTHRL